MPIGLPAAGIDPISHYSGLSTNLDIEIASDNTVKIWTTDNDLYDNIHAMVRSAVRYYRSGSTTPDGSTMLTNTLLLKTWLWEFLALQKSNSGMIVPSLISYGSIDEPKMESLVQSEIQANPRYSKLTNTDRASLLIDFMNGDANILVSAGTKLAKASIDLTPPKPSLGGYSRLDLQFIGWDGTILDPYVYFDIWKGIGGPFVEGHPLLHKVAREIEPTSAPVEGETRIKVRGTNFDATSNIKINGISLSSIRMNAAKTLLFGTLPPLEEGTHDVVISTQGQADKIVPSAVRFVSDVEEAARAVLQSTLVRLEELKLQAQYLDNSGNLIDEERIKLQIDLEQCLKTSYDLVEGRIYAMKHLGYSPTLGKIYSNNIDPLEALIQDIRGILE